MERDAYLAWKRDVVAKSFALAGIAAEVEPIVPIAAGTRRRAVFSAVKTARGVMLGFQRRGSNEIISIEECPVLVPAIVARLAILREIAAAAVKPRRVARITVVAADNGLDIAVADGGRPDDRVLGALGRLAGDASLARLTVDGREVFVNRRPEIDVGGAALSPSAGGFVQASAAAEAAMAEAVLRHVGDARPVLDLFAGCGTFSLRLARRTPVTAVEGDAALLAALDAVRAPVARPQAGRPPVGVISSATRWRRRSSPRSAAVVFDPPAAGAKAQAEALAQSRVQRRSPRCPAIRRRLRATRAF